MRALSLIIISLLVTLNVGAQVSHGGKPVGVSNMGLKLIAEYGHSLPDVRNMLKSAPVENGGIRYKTLKFAHTFDVNLTTENSGRWSTLNNGTRVWRLYIKSEGAKTVNIIFSKFKLPEKAKLFLYNPDMSHVLGSFTSKNNKQGGALPVMPVKGEELIVEYIEPFDVDFNGELEIGKINHDYLGIYNQLRFASVGNFGSSQSCEVDIGCDDGWEDQRRSVVKMIIDGNELCTGALVNNTAQNAFPYVLTAAHCFKDHAFNASGTIFIFNYEVPNCFTSIEGSREQSVAGGVLRAWSEQTEFKNTDFALVEMSIQPPAAYRPYYAGWDASLVNDSNIVTIHHPNGDVKKVSYDRDNVVLTSLIVNDFYYKTNSHWWIKDWESGVTEGGSSGCPVISSNGLITGALSAGQASCDNPVNDFYYNLNKVWTSHADETKTLKYWLDPLNTGLKVLQGYYPDEYESVHRFSNVKKSDDIESISLGAYGYQSGFNNIFVNSFAERYSFEDTCRLFGFYFVPFTGSVSSSSSIRFKVWEGGTVPGDEIWSKQISIKEWIRTQTVGDNYGEYGGYYTKAYYKDKENFVAIDEEVYPGEDFYIGYEIIPAGPTDTFALYQVVDRGSSGSNTAYFRRNDEWQTYPNYAENPVNTSLFMDVVVKFYKNSSDTTIPTLKSRIVKYIEPSPAIGEYFTFHFSEPLTNNAFITLYTLNGSKIGEWIIPFGSTTYDTDLSEVTRGVYLVKIRFEDRSELHRLVNLVK